MNENNFTNVAKKVAGERESILSNRTKVSTEYLIQNYPDGFYVTGFDIIPGKRGEYAVITLDLDMPYHYYAGGKCLTEICKAWADMYGGDTAAASDALRSAGGVLISLSNATTKTGRPFVKVHVH